MTGQQPASILNPEDGVILSFRAKPVAGLYPNAASALVNPHQPSNQNHISKGSWLDR